MHYKTKTNKMTKLNYIEFENPPMTYSIIPHAHCMIYKPVSKKKVIKKQMPKADVSGIDYITRPRINWLHYARVLEAKMNTIFKPKNKPLVQSVVYP